MSLPLLSRLLGEGYRLFFLAALGFALAAVGLWVIWLAAADLGLPDPLAAMAAPSQWHAHEMIFGYGIAAAAGFLLTPERGGRRGLVALAGGLWLAGRLAMLAAPWLPPVLVAAVDLAFLPVLGLLLAPMVPRLPVPLRVAFLAAPALLWGANLACHLEWMGLTSGTASAGLRAALCVQAATMLVDGGRLVPGFTRNAMVQAGHETGLPQDVRGTGAASILTTFALALAWLADAPTWLLAGLALAAGAVTLVRAAAWRSLWTRHEAVLWGLHLAWAMTGLGLCALGLAYLGWLPETAGLHLIAIGGMGGMTVAIMVRAALGRTGRPGAAPRPVTGALVLLGLSAVVRAGADLMGPATAALGKLASGVLWLAAFGLVLAVLWPVLRDPRRPRPLVNIRPLRQGMAQND